MWYSSLLLFVLGKYTCMLYQFKFSVRNKMVIGAPACVAGGAPTSVGARPPRRRLAAASALRPASPAVHPPLRVLARLAAGLAAASPRPSALLRRRPGASGCEFRVTVPLRLLAAHCARCVCLSFQAGLVEPFFCVFVCVAGAALRFNFVAPGTPLGFLVAAGLGLAYPAGQGTKINFWMSL